MGRYITVVDSTFELNLVIKMFTPFAANTAIYDPILVDSVEDMVNKVLKKAGGGEIDSLLISGHGTPGIQAVGCGGNGFSEDDGRKSLRLNLYGDGYNALAGGASEQLRRLRGKFSHRAIVTLGGCHVAKGGEGKKLLSVVSYATNTYVQGADKYQYIMIPGWEGNVIRCYHDQHWIAYDEIYDVFN